MRNQRPGMNTEPDWPEEPAEWGSEPEPSTAAKSLDEINAEVALASVEDRKKSIPRNSLLNERMPGEKIRSYLPDIHRALPADVEAEKALLGSALIAPREVVERCDRAGLVPEWFHHPAHGAIFEAVSELWADNQPVDFVTVTARLRKLGKLDECGGAGFVTSLFTEMPTAANAAHYLEIVQEKHFLREVIKSATDLASRAYEESSGADLIRQEAEGFLAALADRQTARVTAPIRNLVLDTMTRIAAGKTEENWGISTGFPNLDAVTRGLRVGNVVAIGGETSAGKTSLALNIIDRVCVSKGHKALIFSLEMTAAELTEVLLQIGSGCNVDAAAEGRLNEHEQRLLMKAADRLAKAPLVIRDEKDISIVQARSIALRERPRFIVADYAQLFSGGKKRYDRGDQEIADISRTFKKFVGEVGATGFLLTQLNDEGKVSGSRMIAKDADQLWIVKNDSDNEDRKGVQISKQRRGRKDLVPFRWIGPCQKFLPATL